MTACMECAANNGSGSLRVTDNTAKIFIGILADLMMISNNVNLLTEIIITLKGNVSWL